MDAERVAEVVGRHVVDRRVATCAQIVLADGARRSRAVVGLDPLEREVGAGSLFRTYCLSKPLLLHALAAAAEQVEVDLDAALGVADLPDDIHPDYGAFSIRRLLTHEAGTWWPTGLVHLVTPSERRREHLTTPPPPPPPGSTFAYSEVAAWEVVGSVLARRTGATVEELVLSRRRVGALAAGIALPADLRDDEVRSTVRLNAAPGPAGLLPLLHEETPLALEDPTVGLLGYGSATGLLDLLASVTGTSLAGADEAWQPLGPLVDEVRRPSVVGWDADLDRQACYSLGVATDLPANGYGDRFGPRSHGVSGMANLSVVAVDRDHGVGVAAYLNGVVEDADLGRALRAALIDACLDELAVARV